MLRQGGTGFQKTGMPQPENPLSLKIIVKRSAQFSRHDHFLLYISDFDMFDFLRNRKSKDFFYT
jgi:hypothetical protein